MSRRFRLAGAMHRRHGQPVKHGAELVGYVAWTLDPRGDWSPRDVDGVELAAPVATQLAAAKLVAAAWTDKVDAAGAVLVEPKQFSRFWIAKRYSPSHWRHASAPKGVWWGPLTEPAAQELAKLLRRPTVAQTVTIEEHAQGWTPEGLIVAGG